MDPFLIPLLVEGAKLLGSAVLDAGAKRSVDEAWDLMVGAVKRRLGRQHAVPALIEQLPETVADPERLRLLEGELVQARVVPDEDLAAAMERLAKVVESVRDRPTVGIHTMNIESLQGSVNTFGNVTIVNHNGPPRK